MTGLHKLKNPLPGLARQGFCGEFVQGLSCLFLQWIQPLDIAAARVETDARNLPVVEFLHDLNEPPAEAELLCCLVELGPLLERARHPKESSKTMIVIREVVRGSLVLDKL